MNTTYKVWYMYVHIHSYTYMICMYLNVTTLYILTRQTSAIWTLTLLVQVSLFCLSEKLRRSITLTKVIITCESTYWSLVRLSEKNFWRATSYAIKYIEWYWKLEFILVKYQTHKICWRNMERVNFVYVERSYEKYNLKQMLH